MKETKQLPTCSFLAKDSSMKWIRTLPRKGIRIYLYVGKPPAGELLATGWAGLLAGLAGLDWLN